MNVLLGFNQLLKRQKGGGSRDGINPVSQKSHRIKKRIAKDEIGLMFGAVCGLPFCFPPLRLTDFLHWNMVGTYMKTVELRQQNNQSALGLGLLLNLLNGRAGSRMFS